MIGKQPYALILDFSTHSKGHGDGVSIKKTSIVKAVDQKQMHATTVHSRGVSS